MPIKLIAIGLSHHSVPVEIREKVAFSPHEAKHILERLKDSIAEEALLVSTCNRTELYVRPASDELSAEYLIDFLLESKEIPANIRASLRKEFVRLSYCDAILHLFDVIAGIESQVIGDHQIFAQVKDAFRIAEEVGTAGSFMTKLAHSAFRVAKRVRSETQLGVGAGTISYAAVEFARKVHDDFQNRSALIIGAGETAELSALHLIEKNIGTIYVANRTIEHAHDLINSIRKQETLPKCHIIKLTEIDKILGRVDIIISSTGSNRFLLHRSDVEKALNARTSSVPMVFVDIAVPRDIDPEVAGLPNVFLKDIDDLALIVDNNLEKRKAEIPKIREIISEEFNSFQNLFARLEVGPTITELRQKFEQIRSEELEHNRSKLTPNQFCQLEEMTRKMMSRLLHTPTIMLKEPRTTKDDLQARIEIIRILFALDENHQDGSKS